MLRLTILVLALSCAITCTTYAQQAAPPSATPPAAPAGQNAAMPGMPANPAPATAAPAATNVPMNEPVLTLKGACEPKAGSAPPAGCVSSLTREQFEKLTNALQPPEKGPVPPEVRRRFATQYAKLLTFADVARQLGLENDPKVQEIYAFAKNQILSEALNQHYMEEFAHPTNQQIEDYYNQNIKKYQEMTLQRIVIPANPGNSDKAKPSEAERKAYADKIRERWVAGEDAVKLQQEAFTNSGITTKPPDVNVGARRPGSLSEAHGAVFELKVNDISQPFSDASGFYIYKVLAARQIPLSEVRDSISQILQHQMFTDKMQQVQSAVTPVLNDAYFGPEAPPTMPRGTIRPGGPPMPGGPPRGAGAPPPGAPGAGAGGASPPASSGAPPADSAPSPK